MNRYENAQTEGLVQPEGVNAGSAYSTAESRDGAPQTRSTDELTRGGRPEKAGEQVHDAPNSDQVVCGPWGDHEPGAPSLQQSKEDLDVRRR